MPVAKSFSVALNALPVLLATRHVLILKRDAITDRVKPLMSAMAVIRRSLTVQLPLPTSTPIPPRFADRKYREKLSNFRAGINMTKRELRQKDRIITPLIEQGQSPY